MGGEVFQAFAPLPGGSLCLQGHIPLLVQSIPVLPDLARVSGEEHGLQGQLPNQ